MVVVACTVSAASLAQTYKVIDNYKLPGTSARGISADSAARKLYVAGDDGVAVLNLDTGAKLGMISLKQADDVLLPPATPESDDEAESAGSASTHSRKMAFASGHGSVIAFSLADLKPAPAQALPTGGNTTLCYDDEADTVVAVSSEGSMATFNAETGKLHHATRIETGNGQIACGTLHHVYVADTKHNVIHVLNDATGKNDGDLPMLDGTGPTGLALDTKGRRLFVSCENHTIEVIDTDAGFTFLQLPGGEGPAQAQFLWTPQGKGQWKAAAFVAQSDGSLIGVRMNAYINYSIGGKYKLPPGLQGIAYDAKTHHLFLSASTSGTPSVIVTGY